MSILILLTIAIVLMLLTSCRKEVAQSDDIKPTNLEVEQPIIISAKLLNVDDQRILTSIASFLKSCIQTSIKH